MSHSECVITVLLRANQHCEQQRAVCVCVRVCVSVKKLTVRALERLDPDLYVLHTEYPPRYPGSSKGILENSSRVSQVQHFVVARTFLGDNNHYNTPLPFPCPVAFIASMKQPCRLVRAKLAAFAFLKCNRNLH